MSKLLAGGGGGTPPSSQSGKLCPSSWGVEPSTKFSKGHGWIGSPFLEGNCWERGG